MLDERVGTLPSSQNVLSSKTAEIRPPLGSRLSHESERDRGPCALSLYPASLLPVSLSFLLAVPGVPSVPSHLLSLHGVPFLCCSLHSGLPLAQYSITSVTAVCSLASGPTERNRISPSVLGSGHTAEHLAHCRRSLKF